MVELLLEKCVGEGEEKKNERSDLADKLIELAKKIEIEKVETSRTLKTLLMCLMQDRDGFSPSLFDLIVQLGEKIKDVIFYGAYHGNEKGVQKVLEVRGEGEEEQEIQKEQKSLALHVAAKAGHKRVMEILLENGADPKFQTKGRWTPLDYAAFSGHTDIVELLIQNVISTTPLPDSLSFLQLDGAIKRVSEDIVKLGTKSEEIHFLSLAVQQNALPLIYVLDYMGGFIGRKEDEEQKDRFYDAGQIFHNGYLDYKHYPVACAVVKGHSEALRMLLMKGASIHFQFLAKINNHNEPTSPIKYATCYGNNLDVVKVLINEGGLTRKKITSLVITAFEKHKEGKDATILEWFCDNMDVMSMRYDTWQNEEISFLHKAALEGNVAAIKLLLKKQFLIESKSEARGNTALHYAVEGGQKWAVEVLLEMGADKEARTNTGDTPIMLATAIGNEEVLKILAKRGENKRAKNNKGRNVLHCAGANFNHKAAKILCESGYVERGDLEERDEDGRTPGNYIPDLHLLAVILPVWPLFYSFLPLLPILPFFPSFPHLSHFLRFFINCFI